MADTYELLGTWAVLPATEARTRAKAAARKALEMAVIYAGLAEKDQAFEWLEKGYEERDDLIAELRFDPRWESLHSDPRFQNLLRRMNLAP